MRPFRMRGTVVHGFGRGGSQLGYPTANIEIDDAVIAQLQPYKGLVICGFGCIEAEPPTHSNAAHTPKTDNGPFQFAMSVGHNPQFKNKDLSAEVHFLHKFERDFYGSVIRIIALDQVRVQAAFHSLDALIAAIDGDVEATKTCLAKSEFAAYKDDSFVNPDAPVDTETVKTPFFALL